MRVIFYNKVVYLRFKFAHSSLLFEQFSKTLDHSSSNAELRLSAVWEELSEISTLSMETTRSTEMNSTAVSAKFKSKLQEQKQML